MEPDIQLSFTKHQQRFNQIVANIPMQEDEDRSILLCSQAAIFAVNNPCGVFNSRVLEETLLEVASKHSVPLSDSYKPNSFLHVMTRAYTSGGHTRVCERWIQNAQSGQTHSVALISQGHRQVPWFLKEVVQDKSGSLISIEGDSPLDIALKLRKIASTSQYIVLHVHMYDVIPLLAFGTKEFQRPVILFNHGDHLFWLGCSIADLTVNFRTFSTEFNKTRRGIKNNYVLPLPVTAPKKLVKHDALALKASLGFARDSKVIITMASPYKFKPFGGLDFIKTVEEILALDSKAVLLAIGPSKQEPEWNQAYKRTNGRVNSIGIIPNTEIARYIQIADVALESFPLGSPTALLDIIKYNIPCVILKTPVNGIDAFDEAKIYCNSTSEVASKAVSLLQKTHKDNKLYKILERDCFPKGFSKKLVELNKHLPTKHQIHHVIQDINGAPTDFELFILENSLQSKKNLKSAMRSGIRRLIYLYIMYSPLCVIKGRLYRFLNSFGLI